MTFGPLFVVDVLDNTGAVLGDGPLANVISAEITEELDRAGKVSVSVPATDSRAISLLSAENRVRVKTKDGALATGIIESFGTSSGPPPTYQASGPDLFGGLIYLSTGYDRVYDNLATSAAIIGTDATATSLLGGTGWTQGTVTPARATDTAVFNAQTILQSLGTLAQQMGDHFRQGTTEKTLDWGLFGADSGIRLMNIHQSLDGQESLEDIAIVSSLTINSLSADVENRMFPLGKNKFDMRDASNTSANILVQANEGPTGATTTLAVGATAGDASITLASGTGFVAESEVWIGDASDWTQPHEIAVIASGGVAGAVLTFINILENSYSIGADVIQNPQFYIEDAASQGTFGLRESCPQFAWIGPVDQSADSGQQERAADVLYAAANARLTRYKDEYENYTLGAVYNLPSDLRVGQKVRLVYRGSAGVFGGTLWVDVDDDFYVLKIVRRWKANGEVSATLTVANVTRPAPNNENLIIYNLDTLTWIGL